MYNYKILMSFVSWKKVIFACHDKIQSCPGQWQKTPLQHPQTKFSHAFKVHVDLTWFWQNATILKNWATQCTGKLNSCTSHLCI